MRRIILTFMLVIGLLSFTTQPTEAQNRERLFPETGWRVGGRLLEFWEANGGLPVFGLPIGPQQLQTTPQGQFAAQQFERERLELHPESARPYDVQLGRLGEELLLKQGRDWRGPSAGVQLEGPCRSFAETGRAVCGAFLNYWQSHGLDLGDPGMSERESLALFGLPLTEPNYETNSSGDNVITQWFERARFEYHPNNSAAYQVLLGRLGAELAGEAAAMPTLSVQATPAAVEQGHTTSIQVQIPGAKAVRGQLGDAPIALFNAGDRGWTGLGGVP
ncbi:MAG: hypothetical protein JOZ51_01490, partial [Chloroflexi bacterium]|nr:hypothetical protein [Chloroflexota bacterium]